VFLHVRVIVLVEGACEVADAALVPEVVSVRGCRVLLQLGHYFGRKFAQVASLNIYIHFALIKYDK